MLEIDLTHFAQTLYALLERHHSTLQGSLADYVQSGRLLRDLAAAAREIIIERTTRGHLDIDGKPFKPYTEQYASWKKRTWGYSGPPNLLLSGRMLNDIFLRQTSPLQGRLTFRTKRSAEIADSHQEGSAITPHRPFFGILQNTKYALWLRERIIMEFSKYLITHGFRR